MSASPESAAAPAKTADRLLDVAADLFRRKGYAQTTTRELAEELGIKKATLYHHISNKEDLLEALCHEALRRLTAEVESIEAADPDRLRAIFVRHLTSAVRDQNLHAATLSAIDSLGPERRERVATSRKAYERMLREVVRADQKAGRLRGDVSAENLTHAMINLLNWTIYWYRPDGGSSAEELAEQFADVFLQGATPR
ncbi:MAG: transcriptional regulator, TetR family [Solirubrobacterales bacterium]|nr:transcriptional regulator, TetR family [Solirubrobacterales bacterium]